MWQNSDSYFAILSEGNQDRGIQTVKELHGTRRNGIDVPDIQMRHMIYRKIKAKEKKIGVHVIKRADLSSE